MKHSIREAVVGRRRRAKDRSLALAGDAGRQIPRDNVAERCAHAVEHTDRGVRVVNARRQRAHCDLDQLTHRIFEVRPADALAAERRRPPDRRIDAIDRGLGAGDDRAREHEVAGPDQQLDPDPVRGGPAGERITVEFLKIAAALVRDSDGRRTEGPPFGYRRRLSQGQRRHCFAQILANQLDHRVDVDPARHVSDEGDQRADAQESEQDADRHRRMRNEDAFVLRSDAAQDHQRVGKRAEEGA